MKPVFNLFLKDLKQFLADRTSVILSFIVPMFMALVFGFAFGGTGGGTIDDLEIDINVADNDQSEISGKLVSALEKDDVFNSTLVSEEEAYASVKDGKRSVAVIIPNGFGEKVEAGEKTEIKVIYDPANPMEHGITEGMMQGVLFSADLGEYIMPNMIRNMLEVQGENEASIQVAMAYVTKYVVPWMKTQQDSDDKSSTGDSSGSNLFSQNDDFPIQIVSEQVVGEDVDMTGAYVQAIVSAMVIFMLFSVSHGATTLLTEQRSGTLKRLLVSPLTIEGILAGKMLTLVATGLIQVYWMLIFGWLVFKLNIWADPVSVFLMAFATILMASGLGILLAGIAKTEEQVPMITNLVILTSCALGGAMVPRFIMPTLLKQIGLISPVAWAMDGFHNVFWRQQGVMGMLPNFSVLVAMGLVFMFIGIVLVKKHLKHG